MLLQGKPLFDPLRGTELQAKDLGNLLGNLVSLTDGKATVSAMRSLERPAVLHIATHGLFLGSEETRQIRPELASEILPELGHEESLLILTHPMWSGLDNPLLFAGLALAGANNGGAGVISALEIAGLNLQGTQLVVLSACDTGLGALRGDEFYGLRRALSLAGAVSDVTSLWKVKDDATSALMTYFYKLLLEGRGRVEALRLAKQRFQNEHPEWRHPHYWAAFVASGDWRPMEHLTPRSK
jgi:CHAT domain-containing protein